MLHSFHLAELPPAVSGRALVRPPAAVPGLRHAECLAMMRLGAPTVSLERFQVRRLAVFATWDDPDALDRYLDRDPLGRRLADGWHVRLQYLRRFGHVAALGPLPQRAGDWDPDEPAVAVTLARLRLPELPASCTGASPSNASSPATPAPPSPPPRCAPRAPSRRSPSGAPSAT
ncbi:hypothetical protein [Pimelobacter sp. 30-1]|uniref:hypothetical protein n=1 Tax=Pimelobacter sp. 30-1 TaxID=2004991 RepID=UPI00207BC781|nr:hypothetical protein [Pimelobacter sp. 30-1]